MADAPCGTWRTLLCLTGDNALLSSSSESISVLRVLAYNFRCQYLLVREEPISFLASLLKNKQIPSISIGENTMTSCFENGSLGEHCSIEL